MTVEELNIATTSYNRMCKYKKLADSIEELERLSREYRDELDKL